MKPTIRLVACLALAIAVVSGCGYFRSPEKHAERAQDLIDKGEHNAALIELRNALQSKPDLPQARLLLAEVMLWHGDAVSAERELKRVPAGFEAAKRADLALRIDIAAGRAQDVLEAIGTPAPGAPASAWLYRGQALQALERFTESEDAFRKALAADPKLLLALAGVVDSLSAQGRSADARAFAEQMTKDHPQSALAWFMHGSQLANAQSLKEAQLALERAGQSAARQLDVQRKVTLLATLIEVQLANREQAKARASSDVLARIVPNSPLAILMSARVSMAGGDYSTATTELRRALSAAPQFTRARFLLAVSLAAQGNLEQASSELDTVVQQMPQNLEARQLLAQLRMRLEDPAGAMRVLVPALEADTADPGVNLLFEEARLQSNKAGASVGMLERSYRKSPANRALRLQLAGLYIEDKQPAKALALLEGMQGEKPDPVVDRLTLSAIAQTEGVEAANRRLDQMLAARPADPVLAVLASNLRIAQGDIERAQSILEAAVKRAPGDSDPRLALARLQVRRGQRDAAVANLEQLRKTGTRTTEARLLLAQLALQRDDVKLADQLIDEAVAGASNAETRNAAGSIYLSTGRYDKAIEHFRAGTQADSTSVSLWLNLGRAQLALEQVPAARESLERALALRKNWLPAEGVLTFLELQHGQPAAARARVDALVKARPNDPGVRVLEAEVFAAQRNFAEAERSLDAAAKVAPSANLAVKAYQLRTAGSLANPTEPLTKWLAANPNDLPVRGVLAEAHARAGASARAAEQYEQIVAREPRDVVSLNNLAWLYFEAGDERATELARRAHALAPNAPAVADTLGWILVQDGKVEEGLKLLGDAAARSPTDGEMQYHYAAALAKSGAGADAEARLRRLLAANDKFSSRADAEKLLASLSKGAGTAP
jgi:tetratricopeptide (TPR) repeat protein